MRRIREAIRARAGELLRDGTVSSVLGWVNGEFCYDPTPAFFETEEQLDGLVYNGFSAAMLSKYLIAAGKKEGKVLVFLKPCDTYSYNHLLRERKVDREKAYIIGVGCDGMLDMDKIRALGIKSVKSADEEGDTVVLHTLSGDKTLSRGDILLEKCASCKSREHKVYDELIGDGDGRYDLKAGNRFARVGELEGMTPDERFAFWRGELSRCIRCNACRNACPVCSCNQCVFDNPRSGVISKANADSFEENMFHIIRAFHVAGRCTDCGECSRVCPQNIPLHLLNRKFIKDINEFYGEYEAGADIEGRTPLTQYESGDVEPGIVHERGGAK
jgi:ferredoxin